MNKIFSLLGENSSMAGIVAGILGGERSLSVQDGSINFTGDPMGFVIVALAFIMILKSEKE